MTESTPDKISFHPLNRRKVEAAFTGGHITSDAGLLLLRQVDKKLSLTESIAPALHDRRRKASCHHSVLSMLRQRVYALAAGYEGQNDHNTLRGDIALQTALERSSPLASQSTISRWESRCGRCVAAAVNAELVQQFIAACKGRPKKLILDFDATNVPLHGRQEGRFFSRLL